MSNASQHLSHITTLWTLVYQAHRDEADRADAAQRLLLERYGGAVHRYLLGALRDPEAADDLFQDFCVRFLRGAFRNAERGRGRFRDFLKTAVYHLVIDYQKAKHKRTGVPLDDAELAVAPPSQVESDREFLESWRAELMDRAWIALENLEKNSGQPHFTVLRFRTDHPLLSSQELAEHLGPRLGKSLTVDAARQALHRARDKFTDLLLAEVEQSLHDPERLEEELAEIGLLTYCQSALLRRQRN